MNGVVLFDFSFFGTRYAELAYIGQSLLQLYFNEAAMYCDNTASSPIQDSSIGGQRYVVLHMATAHIAALNAPSSSGSPSSPLVGRISNATQGSVSVATQNEYPEGTAQWWQQTKYGAAFWNATKRYRTFRYINRPRRDMDVYSPLAASDPGNPPNPSNPNPLPSD